MPGTDHDEEDRLLHEGELTGPVEYDRFVYFTFLLIGVSYLWPWNALLAATPYFLQRLSDHEIMQDIVSSVVMTISTVTSTLSMLALTKLQKDANYPRRIIIGELTFGLAFVFLAVFCVGAFTAVPSSFFFLVVVAAVFTSSIGCSLAQNGSFAIMAKFGPIYTQAAMVGQAVAGVLPPLFSMLSALLEEDQSANPNVVKSPSSPATAAYFLVSTVVALVSVVLFKRVERGHVHASVSESAGLTAEAEHHKEVPISVLFAKLKVPSFAVFMTFSVTLMYPVFVVKTEPVSKSIPTGVFFSLAFFVWNFGDLAGRMLCGNQKFVVKTRVVFLSYAVLRLLFIPLFFLFRFQTVPSDFLYLLTMFLFGLTNGHLGSSAMMSTALFVDEEEREPAGGFMTLSLYLGLLGGSIFSFPVAGMIA